MIVFQPGSQKCEPGFFVEHKMFNVRIWDDVFLHQNKERNILRSADDDFLFRLNLMKWKLMMNLKCSTLQFLML